MNRTKAVWTLIAAPGASYLVVGLGLALREVALPFARELEVTLTNRMLYFGGLAEPILLSLTFAVGAATGTFVARRAGGTATVAAYVVPVVIAAISFVYAASLREHDLRGSECCVIVTVGDLPVAAAAMCIPTMIGLITGATIARSRAERAGANTFLEAAGSYATVGAFAALALGPPLQTLTWDHHYVPVSLAVVPLVSVALAAVLVPALRSISSAWTSAARNLET